MALKTKLIFVLFGLPLLGHAQSDSISIGELDSIDGFYIPTSVNDCITELENMVNDSSKSEFASKEEFIAVGSIHLGFGMLLRNRWGLWKGSRLALYFNDLGIYHPDYMSSIILTSFHRHLNGVKIDLEGQINEVISNLEEIRRIEEGEVLTDSEKATRHWLRKKKVLIKQLPLVDPDEIRITCDSFLHRIRYSGDTIVIWTGSSMSVIDTISLANSLDTRKVGSDAYVRNVYPSGEMEFIQLRPKHFLVKEDSLYEMSSTCLLSDDSLSYLYNKRYELIMDGDTAGAADIQKIISDNYRSFFKLIFHPDLFTTDSIFHGNIAGDKITIRNKWKIDGKYYYDVIIRNHSGKYGTKYGYVFDENYRFIKWDGCNREILRYFDGEHRVNQN